MLTLVVCRHKQTYVSPSDNIMSPATQKLSALKGKRFAQYVAQFPIALFAVSLRWPPGYALFSPRYTPVHSLDVLSASLISTRANHMIQILQEQHLPLRQGIGANGLQGGFGFPRGIT